MTYVHKTSPCQRELVKYLERWEKGEELPPSLFNNKAVTNCIKYGLASYAEPGQGCLIRIISGSGRYLQDTGQTCYMVPNKKARVHYERTFKEVNSEQLGAIAGMLLGDGCLTIPDKNSSLRIQHTPRQEEYLHFKGDILSEFVDVTYGTVGGKYPGVTFRTKIHSVFTELRKLVYPNGEKVITQQLLDYLTPLGIAIWYMDDGYLGKDKSYNKSGVYRISRREAILNPCTATLEECELITNYFQNNYGVRFKILKDGKYHRLIANATNIPAFFDIIEPYIIPSMRYKLDLEYNENYPKKLAEQSSVPGVSQKSETGRWQARVSIGKGQRKLLGYYKTREEAEEVVLKYKQEMGEISG